MRDDKEKLDKILECIDRITAYTAQGKEEYFANTMIQDAVVRNLQILGESFKDLSEELEQQILMLSGSTRLASETVANILITYFGNFFRSLPVFRLFFCAAKD